MLIRILGSAAGGGVPQWNCRCANCVAARSGSGDATPRTQSCVAVSADGQAWFLLNVSPDIRQQLQVNRHLWPPPNRNRGTAIAGCVLTDAEIDHTLGLLQLREGGMARVYCTALVRRWLGRYLDIESVLRHFGSDPWTELSLDASFELPLPDGAPSGLLVRAFALDGHVPRFVDEAVANPRGSVIGLALDDRRTGGRLVYAPCVGSLSENLRRAVRDADCILLDGTFWSDDEPIRNGIGERTAVQMGHWPVSAPDGSLGWLALLPARNRAYVHINNTNPMLRRNGPEHREVMDAGVMVGADGESFEV